MPTRINKQAEMNARAALLNILEPGDTVYAILRHVSKSGMFRRISLYVIKDDQPLLLDSLASQVLGIKLRKEEGIPTTGCGMDMGFHLVYSLAHRLFDERDPRNIGGPPNPRSAGYFLNHRWM